MAWVGRLGLVVRPVSCNRHNYQCKVAVCSSIVLSMSCVISHGSIDKVKKQCHFKEKQCVFGYSMLVLNCVISVEVFKIN